MKHIYMVMLLDEYKTKYNPTTLPNRGGLDARLT